MDTPDKMAAAATTATAQYLGHRESFADLQHREAELTDTKAPAKDAAIRRIMARDNIKYTPAEALAETDQEYAAHLKELRDVVRKKELAFGNAVAAAQSYALAVALIHLVPSF